MSLPPREAIGLRDAAPEAGSAGSRGFHPARRGPGASAPMRRPFGGAGGDRARPRGGGGPWRAAASRRAGAASAATGRGAGARGASPSRGVLRGGAGARRGGPFGARSAPAPSRAARRFRPAGLNRLSFSRNPLQSPDRRKYKFPEISPGLARPGTRRGGGDAGAGGRGVLGLVGAPPPPGPSRRCGGEAGSGLAQSFLARKPLKSRETGKRGICPNFRRLAHG